MQVTTKAGTMLATLKSTSALTKSPTGSFEAVLSIPTLDRDGEVVDAGAFEPLPDHITIDLDHAMTVEKTVASGRPYYDGAVLRFEGTYASTPLAQMTRTLVDEGHIRTMSVAYMGAVYEVDTEDGRPHLRRAELLNAGIVGIPSNREALITASKSLSTLLEASAPELVSTGDKPSTESVQLDPTSTINSTSSTITTDHPEQTAAPAAAVVAPAAFVGSGTASARVVAFEASRLLDE